MLQNVTKGHILIIIPTLALTQFPHDIKKKDISSLRGDFSVAVTLGVVEQCVTH